MTAALSEGIYDGPAQKVQDLFIRGRQEDTLKVSMEDLPDEIPTIQRKIVV